MPPSVSLISPSVQAALTIRDYSDFDGLQFKELAQGLDEAMRPIHEGDFSQVESLMFSQAVALDAIRRHRAWEKSTGPISAGGKSVSSKNAVKHGFRSQAWLALSRAMRKQLKWLEDLNG